MDAIPYEDLQSVLSYADVGYVSYAGDELNTLFSAPGKVYEYLKAGLVLMTDETCCIASYLHSYRCGAILPQKPHVDHVSTALSALAENPSEVKAMKRRAFQLFVDHFVFEVQVRPLLELAIALASEEFLPPQERPQPKLSGHRSAEPLVAKQEGQ